MNQNLTDLFRKKQKKSETDTGIDWDSRRNDYLAAVDALYKKIEAILAEPIGQKSLTLHRRPKSLTETYIGTYSVEDLVLVIGDEQVRFSPRGRNVVGAAGRVDVIGERGEATLVLRRRGWEFVQARQPALRVVPFDESTLAEMLRGCDASLTAMPVPLINHATAEPQTLDEIRDWHRGIVDALVDQRTSVQHAIRTGSAIAWRFLGMTEADVDAHYDVQRRELDRLTALNLVASTEAAIKVDYFRRVGGKLKDPLARAYRKFHSTLSAKKQLRPDFDADGILKVLKKSSRNGQPHRRAIS